MPQLIYPFENTPDFGTTLEVASGVRWLRMPLPMSLDHINLYLLEDDDGWWVVDTGMKWGKVQQYWQSIFDNELDNKPVKGVFVTHMHPDHVGQAGWICDRFRVPLYMTFGEYYNAHNFAKMRSDDLSWAIEDFYRSVGFEADFFEQMKKNFRGYAGIVEPIPSSFIRLEDGDEYLIGGRRWRVVVGRGHSPEHACLYCEELAVMLSGDQVIPKITPNVSVIPAEPEGNPLKKWMESLHTFLQFPEQTLVLPAHNTPFRGLQTRLNALIAHHEDHLLALEEACITPKKATELLPVLFKRELDVSQMTMAIGECVAHLSYLTQAGKMERNMDEQGVFYYKAVDPSLAQRARPGTHHQVDAPIEV